MSRVSYSFVLTLFFCAACSSKPTHYYVLTPTAPATLPVRPPYPIHVDPVHIPPVLDRPEIVRRDSANGLKLDDRERWAASLGEMTRNVLAENLSRRLPAGSIILPNAPAPPAAAALVVDISQFDELPNGQVNLVGSWTLMRGNPASAVLSRDFSLTQQTADVTAAGQAAAMSALLAALSDAIARDLTPAAALGGAQRSRAQRAAESAGRGQDKECASRVQNQLDELAAKSRLHY